MERFFHALVRVFVLTLSITGITQADQLALPGTDIIAPVVTQNNHVSTIDAGEDHQILVTVTDNMALKSVILFHRGVGHSEYQAITMRNVADTDDYVVTIRADQISVEGLEYYIQAADSAGNTLLHGYAFSPVIIAIKPSVTDTTLTALTEPEPKLAKETSYKKWLWIGLGALAVGAIAASGGGGGGGGDDDSGGKQPTITVTTPVPLP